VVLWQEAKRI